jgi:hypothetical protein
MPKGTIISVETETMRKKTVRKVPRLVECCSAWLDLDDINYIDDAYNQNINNGDEWAIQYAFLVGFKSGILIHMFTNDDDEIASQRAALVRAWRDYHASK